MGLAGYKTISILFLIVLVALAGGSPVFAQDGLQASITPAAACPGATVSISVNIPVGPSDVVGGGISIAAVSPLANGEVVVSSDPDGLVAKQDCGFVTDTTVGTLLCTFVVSESAKCGRYTVTVTLPDDGLGASVSGIFDVAGSCCAVGGCVQPVNTFALLSPWLAVIGLVGCVAVVVVAKKR
jgi:hypothetical protein